MLFIHDTVSLCNTCYRHVPAFVFERDGQIFLKKKCPFHGESEILVEPDAALFHSLEYVSRDDQSILFEITDKCQLECPHCYHLPDNKTQDRTIDDILEQLRSFPKESFIVMAGAEPSLRPDFIEVVKSISSMNHFNDNAVNILTNGIKFSSVSFCERAVDAGLNSAFIGLNHYSYNGPNVHQQQLTGIHNFIKSGGRVDIVSYTLETLDHIPDILDEVASLKNSGVGQFRIRCGSFIGRSSDSQRSYISNTIKAIENYVGKENLKMIPGTDHNLYHINLMWNGAMLRIIQWPDVQSIDMEELNMGPYCQFYGKPITNFVHQVIVRDIYKNMKFPLYDGVPNKFTIYGDKTYWRDTFTGMKEISDYDYKSNTLLADRVPQF